jgi:hypothetical protein
MTYNIYMNPQANKILVALLISATTLSFMLPFASQAQTFDPNNVISDEVIRNHRTMSLMDIHLFLGKKGGLGNKFDVDPTDGLLKGTAQLIYDASNRHEVNPQYLLALIQKESSAVESADPGPRQLDFATGYGVCDSCSKEDNIALKNKGLAKQIEAGAGYVKWFWENWPSWPSLPRPGEARKIDGQTVIPANLATAAMYGYTPHLHGNRLLRSVWNRWWRDDGYSSFRFPDGSLVRNEKTGQIGLIRVSQLRLISSPTVLSSRFGSIRPIDVNEYDFAALSENLGPPIRLVEPSLVRTTEDGSIWLLVHGKKRLIASPAAFVNIGFNPEEIEDISLDEISDYPEGELLTTESASPVGYLAQDPRSGGWWWIEGGIRHALHDRALLTLSFYGKPERTLSVEQIDLMPLGDGAKFPDGTLLKSEHDPKVYVISEGKRRPIASEAAFISLGYRWKDIHVVSLRALSLHQDGDEIDLEPTIDWLTEDPGDEPEQ